MESDLLFSLSHQLSSEDAALNKDFLRLFWYCKLKYARNFFRYRCDFKNKKFIMTRMNYEFADENRTPDTFLDIQKQINVYRKYLRKDEWSHHIQLEYIDHVNTWMKLIVQEIVVPIPDIPTKYQDIIDKYNKKYVEKKKKSSRINYEALKQLFGDKYNSDHYDD